MFVALVAALPIFASNFISDGICYEILDDDMVRVVVCQNATDTVAIPGHVGFGGKTYVVSSISNHAMQGCDEVKVFKIPASCTKVDATTFVGCLKLEKILVDPSNNVYCDVDGVLYSHNRHVLICHPQGRKNLEYDIPEGVDEIGDNAFFGCRGLQEVMLPYSLAKIGNMAFAGCRSLTSIILPQNLVFVGNYAFYDCNGLLKIVVDCNRTLEIGIGTFSYDTVLNGTVLLRNVNKMTEEEFLICGFKHFIK